MTQTKLHDFAPPPADWQSEVIESLSRPQKELSCKYLYDAEGSRLFDRICELDEYYPTRTETKILNDQAEEIAGLLGRDCLLAEYGSGSSVKTRILLDKARDLAAYVPVDMSREHWQCSSDELKRDYPALRVLPVCADYTQDFDLPAMDFTVARTVVFFPGSTIGNFSPANAKNFLHRIATLCGAGGGLIIGVDLKKDKKVLERAYDDKEGVTAAFNLNLLTHLNRELGADFQIETFSHRAFFNEDESRIEMHLVSLQEQKVHLNGSTIQFQKGETIHTENSHKYGLEQFAMLANEAGWDVKKVWTDEDKLFSVQYLTVR